MQSTSQFREGYTAARRYFGDGARYALQQISREVEEFRAQFPRLPAPAEGFVSRIEVLVGEDGGVAPEVCGVDD